MSEKSACPYCKGARFINTGYTQKIQEGRRVIYPYTQPCYCELNLSMAKKFGVLSSVPSAHPEDAEKIYQRYRQTEKSKSNYVFYGREPLFLYVVKSFFLKTFTNKSLELLEGINVVDRYNMPAPDNSGRLTVSALDIYDLVVMLFTSCSEPPSLKACVGEVVKNRLRINKPTWIYSPSPDISATKEYHKDYLGDLLERFSETSLAKICPLKGFSDGDSE